MASKRLSLDDQLVYLQALIMENDAGYEQEKPKEAW